MSEVKSLAMAYVPRQQFTRVMNGCDGLAHGTIFQELVMPFHGTRAACNMPYNEGRNCNCR